MSFVATWMANPACNQHHLRGGDVRLVPGCPSRGTSAINEHMFLSASQESGPTKALCWFLPGLVFFLSCLLLHHLTLSPYLLHLVFPVSQDVFFFPLSLQLPYPPFPFSFSSFPFLLVTVWIKALGVMTVVAGMEGQKDRDVITAAYYSGCLLRLRHKKKINTIKSRPGINEFAAKRKATVSDWGEQERMSFSPEIVVVCQE